MPGNRQFTSFDFRREVLAGSTSLTTIGPLKVPVPRELRRRKLYFGIIWTGFSNWVAEAEITFHDGADISERLRQRWGTVFGSSGASSNTWGGASQSWRTITTGFPAYSVDEWNPPANLPNWGKNPACADALTVYGVQQADGVTPQAARLTMFPWEFIGPVEELRFNFLSYTSTTTESTPTIEVFLGMKSFAL